MKNIIKNSGDLSGWLLIQGSTVFWNCFSKNFCLTKPNPLRHAGADFIWNIFKNYRKFIQTLINLRALFDTLNLYFYRLAVSQFFGGTNIAFRTKLCLKWKYDLQCQPKDVGDILHYKKNSWLYFLKCTTGYLCVPPCEGLLTLIYLLTTQEPLLRFKII